MKTIEQKRKERRKVTGEDFSPEFLVNEMIQKLIEYAPQAETDPSFTFLDPACGNCNMLICVLRMKLKAGHDPLQALLTIYGTDIMLDNVEEGRIRLLKEIGKVTKAMVATVIRNIVCTPLSKYKGGSLDYDFDFRRKATIGEIRKLYFAVMGKKLVEKKVREMC